MMAHPSLKMFGLCEAMKWNHLPNAGGLYDQHPDMLDDFHYIFQTRAEHEENERKKEEAKRKRDSAQAGRRTRSRGRY